MCSHIVYVAKIIYIAKIVYVRKLFILLKLFILRKLFMFENCFVLLLGLWLEIVMYCCIYFSVSIKLMKNFGEKKSARKWKSRKKR